MRAKSIAKMGSSQVYAPSSLLNSQIPPSSIASNQREAYFGCSSTTKQVPYCRCNSTSPTHSKQGSLKPAGNFEAHRRGDKKHSDSVSKKDFNLPQFTGTGSNISSKPSGKTGSPQIFSKTTGNCQPELESKTGRQACFSYMTECLMPLSKLLMSDQNKSLNVNIKPSTQTQGRNAKLMCKNPAKSDGLSISLPKHSNVKISIQMLPKRTTSKNLEHDCKTKHDEDNLPKDHRRETFADSILGTESSSLKHSMSNLETGSRLKRFWNSKASLNIKKTRRKSCSPCDLDRESHTAVNHSLLDSNQSYVMSDKSKISQNLGSILDSLNNYEKKPDSEVRSNQYKNSFKEENNEYCTLDATYTSDSVKRIDDLNRNANIKKNAVRKSKFTEKSKIPPPVPPPPVFRHDNRSNTASKFKLAKSSPEKGNLRSSRRKRTTESHWSRAKRNLLNLNQVSEINDCNNSVNAYGVQMEENPLLAHNKNDVSCQAIGNDLLESGDLVDSKRKCNQACGYCCKTLCDKKCSEINDRKLSSKINRHLYSLLNDIRNSEPRAPPAVNGCFCCSQKHLSEKVDIFDCKHSKLTSLLSTAICSPGKASPSTTFNETEELDKLGEVEDHTKRKKPMSGRISGRESKISLPHISSANNREGFLKNAFNRYINSFKSFARPTRMQQS